MLRNNLSDTIIALATPPGKGAIAIIRLSGKDAISIADRFFFGRNLTKVEGHTIHYGKIKDENDKIIDEVLCYVFKAPKSYTKEDVIEFSTHCSTYIIDQILQLFLRNGARQANPGEFTLRAFLNGQMDLSQAEAVADLIASDSAASHDLAMHQMRGGFSHEIKALRDKLVDFASLIELELDFGEEDVEFADRTHLEELVVKIRAVIRKLLDSFMLGNVIKNGVPTVIAGKPNAGKSTLLNKLLNEERAIVSEIAGTTRDTIEESLNIKGVQFRLIDTAGLREAQDKIESIGVERTLEKIDSSSLIIYLFDVTEVRPEDLWKELSILENKPAHLILVANKMDLYPTMRPEEYYNGDLISKENLITISAKNNMNIEYLKEKMYGAILEGKVTQDQTIISNSRHYDALNKANESLTAVLDGLKSGITDDFVAMDIRQALYHLGEITGEISSDDLLGNIFSNFCIGK
jgi:tRNA modification GTPase